MPSTPVTYGYAELANRIEQVLGERLTRSTLRSAVSQNRRGRPVQTRPRMTAGMPAPLPAPSRTAPARFDVAAVEAWLSEHPRLRWNTARAEALQALAAGASIDSVVAAGVAAGLSWRHLTAVLNEFDGGQRSVAGVHKRFRRLLAAADELPNRSGSDR